MTTIKERLTFEQRQAESKKILEKYPDRIPVIVEVSDRNKNPEIYLEKSKFLVPSDLTMGQLAHVIRKRIKLSPEKALFFFVKNTLPPHTQLLGTLYEEYKESCGFLFIEIAEESTFG